MRTDGTRVQPSLWYRFIGLRFFTVYGPRQRPDLAINKFARLHAENAAIPVFGDGSTSRDYTYVANIADHLTHDQYKLIEADVRDQSTFNRLDDSYDAIIHLAAKAGVRPSIADPMTYQTANVIGTQNMLEFARQRDIQQFVFASSSSVYGINPNVPWREDDPQLMPISPYASTKISCELMGHVYSHLYGI